MTQPVSRVSTVAGEQRLTKPVETRSEDIVSGIFTLTSAESKRLIAKGVVALPEVQRAMERGRIAIANGTTNAFVVEELLGIEVDKALYASGNITDGALGVNISEDRPKPFVIINGRQVDRLPTDVYPVFESGDVFIKGANAVDVAGNVGILLGGNTAGTIGAAIGTVIARGAHLIAPVGLEKLIPSVIEASRHCGLERIKYPEGGSIGFMPLVNATVVTEIQALAILSGATAIHVSSGGIGGSEGSVVLVVEGTEDEVGKAFGLVEKIKGEKPVPSPGSAGVRYGKDHPSGG
jgi:hypothetical protein